MRPTIESPVDHGRPAGARRQLARVAGIAACAVVAAGLITLLFLGVSDRLWRIAALLGAAAAVAGVVVLLPASLRARGRLLAGAFLAAVGVLPLVVTADNGAPAPPPAKAVNADYLASLIEKGPFTETLPAPLTVDVLRAVPISGPGAARKVAATEIRFTVPGDDTMGGSAFVETYRSAEDARARASARVDELRTQLAPLWANEGDATSGYCVAGQTDVWTCGRHQGHVFVEVVVFPSNNANHALATESVAAVLRYTDRMTVLASA
jgi:hypothetical protein